MFNILPANIFLSVYFEPRSVLVVEMQIACLLETFLFYWDFCPAKIRNAISKEAREGLINQQHNEFAGGGIYRVQRISTDSWRKSGCKKHNL